MKISIIAATALLFFAAPLQAQQAPTPEELAAASAANVSVAEAYLAAYSTFDVSNIGPFLTEDAVFEDPTSSTQNVDGGAFVFTGKEAVLEGLGDYAAQYKDFTLNYDIERRYESNGVVVFVAQLTWDLETMDGKSFKGTAPIVTAITVRDGMVSRHTDLYDYNSNAVDSSTN